MKEFLLYIFTFIFVYIFYIIFVLKRQSVYKKFKNGKEINYLKYKYDIRINKSNESKISKSIMLANSFILATTVSIIFLFDSLIIQIIVGFICLVVLIILVYHILGLIYRRR